MIVNLSNLKHLDLTKTHEKHKSFLVWEILKEASQLSSMKISSSDLKSLFDNDESCKYLNKMIKKLSLSEYYTLFVDDNVTKEFCKVFSNIEQLSCTINEPCYLLLLLKRLLNLSMLKIYFLSDSPVDLSSVKDEIHKVNGLFHIECTGYSRSLQSSYTITLTIWMDNNMK